ncbi:MAG: hypothetical protein QXY40_06300 [Candidatus Methanomethylicia archaeon]
MSNIRINAILMMFEMFKYSYIMKTTIQVSRRTVGILKELMKRMNVKTYDELIRIMVSEKYRVQNSLFGSNPNLTLFRGKMR